MKRKKVLIFEFILIILLLGVGVVVNAEGSDDKMFWEELPTLVPEITMFDEFENEYGGLGIIFCVIVTIVAVAFLCFRIPLFIFKFGPITGITMCLVAYIYLLQLFYRDAGLLGLFGAIIGVSLAIVGYLKFAIWLEDENENEN